MSGQNDEMIDKFIEETLKATIYAGWFIGAGAATAVYKLARAALDSTGNKKDKEGDWGNKPRMVHCKRCGSQWDEQLRACLACGAKLPE